jgi:hypothetical protein
MLYMLVSCMVACSIYLRLMMIFMIARSFPHCLYSVCKECLLLHHESELHRRAHVKLQNCGSKPVTSIMYWLTLTLNGNRKQEKNLGSLISSGKVGIIMQGEEGRWIRKDCK